MPFVAVGTGPSASPILPPRKGILGLRHAHPTKFIGGSGFSFNIGQFRSIRNGRVFMTKRTALRDLDGTGHHGRDTRFRWSRLRWVKVSSVRRTYARDRAAIRVGSWHVRGLPRFLP
jgi:hypothetical protein